TRHAVGAAPETTGTAARRLSAGLCSSLHGGRLEAQRPAKLLSQPDCRAGDGPFLLARAECTPPGPENQSTPTSSSSRTSRTLSRTTLTNWRTASMRV